MTKKEFLEMIDNVTIDKRKVGKISKLYDSTLPEYVQKVISCTKKSLFFDDERRFFYCIGSFAGITIYCAAFVVHNSLLSKQHRTDNQNCNTVPPNSQIFKVIKKENRQAAAGNSSTGVSPRPMLMGAPNNALRAFNSGVSL